MWVLWKEPSGPMLAVSTVWNLKQLCCTKSDNQKLPLFFFFFILCLYFFIGNLSYKYLQYASDLQSFDYIPVLWIYLWIVRGTIGFPELFLWEAVEKGWLELLCWKDHTIRNHLQMKMWELRGSLEWGERMGYSQPKIWQINAIKSKLV